jgi:hypothetical protein
MSNFRQFKINKKKVTLRLQAVHANASEVLRN